MPYKQKPLIEQRIKNIQVAGRLVRVRGPADLSIAGSTILFPVLVSVILATRGKEFIRCISGSKVEGSCRA